MTPDHEFLSAGDLATVLRLSSARVYRLAHDHLWRRRRIDGMTRYHVTDVRDTLDRLEVFDKPPREDHAPSVGVARPPD